MTVEDKIGIKQFIFFGNLEKRSVKKTVLSLIVLANGDHDSPTTIEGF